MDHKVMFDDSERGKALRCLKSLGNTGFVWPCLCVVNHGIMLIPWAKALQGEDKV